MTSRIQTSSRIRMALFAGLVATVMADPTWANGMRCGSRLVTKGDPALKLLRFCGEPDLTQARRALRPYQTRRGTTYFPGFDEEVWIEDWTYNLGPNKLIRVVRLENGVVRDIKHLGYGF